MTRSIAGLVLAAGGGRRLGGRPKALLVHRGEPLVARAVRVLRAAGCEPVQVVVGADAAAVRAVLAPPPDGPVVVENPDWRSGMGSSLRAGLAALDATDAGAVLVLLVDQPRVGAEAVARVLAAHRAGAALAAAAYGGVRGHPVLLGREHWPGVTATAEGDRGARAHLARHAGALRLVECGDVAAPDDVDRPEDLALLEAPLDDHHGPTPPCPFRHEENNLH
ncbi:4-diphosphocytidyl-2C-methyl-D-erythritol synthase [Streptomyces mashuensis]|uniref:4-diphosphocytidyl-2C-methyl-D-erythritol synthase n=1 Tax=Streptomyces mashuensis TaxID=33904 RepID=A0A919AVV0_9ACTN|nr:NTP transferase domain-containing protein [Streptomyces mashuensis]GHF25993.1 4-diphosphocytidyl-2C-methyl-D-erythritol synthase [Streptomyces mashuensis]